MKKFFSHLLREIFNFGIGWVFGLLATQLVLLFFEERSFSNLWGLWSYKMVVEETTLTIIEWLASAVVGYVIMMQVNKIMEKLKLKYYKQKEPDNN